ncbi:MAG TPA: OmpA family protein [bacterium]|nr:OmpA family protein [bacterium]
MCFRTPAILALLTTFSLLAALPARALSIRFDTIGFDTRSEKPKTSDDEKLANFARILKENPAIHRVRVEGHTDSVESKSDAVDLSVRRAQAVCDRLVAQGIDADRLFVVGYGSSRPVATNATKEGRQNNRRVEFTVVE